MQKRKNIDMLRFYGGDVRERTDDGVLIDTCKDDLWSDKTAYRTLNALLFDGYENEKERIFKEGNKLNPVFVRRLKDTIKIYTGIFKLMCIETEFKEQLKEINKQIEAKEREILQKHSEENLKIYPCKTKEFYESYLYGVHVHLVCKIVRIPYDNVVAGAYDIQDNRKNLAAEMAWRDEAILDEIREAGYEGYVVNGKDLDVF